MLAPAPYVRLRPHVVVVEHEDVLHLVGDETVFFKRPPPALVAGLHALSVGLTSEKLASILGDDAAEWLVTHLDERGALQRSTQAFDSLPTDPTALYFESIAERLPVRAQLQSCRVWIIGCGGVGGLVAQHLVGAGVGHLTLVDFDRVSADNLNRQFLFTREDIGRDKLDAAKERLLALAPTTDIELVRHRLAPEHPIEIPAGTRADACICAADTPPALIRDLVSRLASRLGATFATAGVGLFDATWGPILTREDPVAYHDWNDPAAPFLDLTPLRASFGPTNSFVAACLARDLLHTLVGESAPSRRCRLTLDFRTFELKRFPVSR